MSIHRQSPYQPVHELGTRLLWGPTTGLDGGRFRANRTWLEPLHPRVEADLVPIRANPLTILYQSIANPMSIQCQSGPNPINPRLPTSHHSGTNTLTIQSVNPLPIPRFNVNLPVLDQSINPRTILDQSYANPLPICRSHANLIILDQFINQLPIQSQLCTSLPIRCQLSTNSEIQQPMCQSNAKHGSI